MARLLFEEQAVRTRRGTLASGVGYVVYTDEAGTTEADISATSGASATSTATVVTATSTVTSADIAGLGPSALRFYGPDGVAALYLRSATDPSLGVQEIEAADVGLVTDVELVTHAADTTLVHGITDTAQIQVRELLTQAVVDTYEGRTLHLRTGTHTVATALNLHATSSYVGDGRDETLIQGTSGQDVFLLPTSGDYFYINLRDMQIVGGRRQLSSLTRSTYVDIRRVTFSGPSAECIYLEGVAEEWYLDNIHMVGGTYGFRLANVLFASLNYIDKSTFKDVTTIAQTVNGWRLEYAGAIGSLTWINPIINRVGQDGFWLNGALRGGLFLNPSTEANGLSDSAVILTTGTIASASTTLTVPVTTIANGRPVTIRGAGANRGDLTTTVASGGGTTTLELVDAAATSVTNAVVTTALYDDFHFETSIASPAQVQFVGGTIGLPASAGRLRYAIYNPGFEMALFGTKTTGNVPVYDPVAKTRAIGGSGPIVQYGNLTTLGNTTVLHPYHSNDVALILRGQLSQSVDLQQWQDSSGTVLAVMDKAGVLAPAGLREPVQDHGAMGATEAFNVATAALHTGTLDASLTATLSGAVSGKACSMTLLLTQDAIGGRSVTWPASVKWPGGTPPTLTTTADATVAVTFFSVDGGTTWYGALVGDNLS